VVRDGAAMVMALRCVPGPAIGSVSPETGGCPEEAPNKPDKSVLNESPVAEVIELARSDS